MGGNIDDSRPPLGRPVARYWVLKGQPRSREAEGRFSSVPGSGPGSTSPTQVGLVVSVGGLGFGGVFVNWIVDASI